MAGPRRILRHRLGPGAEHTSGFGFLPGHPLRNLLLVIDQDSIALLLAFLVVRVSHDALEDHATALHRDEQAERNIFGLLRFHFVIDQLLEELVDGLCVLVLTYAVIFFFRVSTLDDVEELLEFDVAGLVGVNGVDDLLHLSAILDKAKSDERVLHLVNANFA